MSDPVLDSFFPFPHLFTPTGTGPARRFGEGKRPRQVAVVGLSPVFVGAGSRGLSLAALGTITPSERTFEQEVEADGQGSLT
jgi:hypothetical protein